MLYTWEDNLALQIPNLHLLYWSEGTSHSTLCKDQRGSQRPQEPHQTLLLPTQGLFKGHVASDCLEHSVIYSKEGASPRKASRPGALLPAELCMKHQPFSRRSTKNPVQCGFSENGGLQVLYPFRSRQKQEATTSKIFD